LVDQTNNLRRQNMVVPADIDDEIGKSGFSNFFSAGFYRWFLIRFLVGRFLGNRY
jgi:hypothetical protein